MLIMFVLGLIMFVLGLIMFFGGKLGFGPAPLVLGIILGPIAEDNFLQGQLIGQSSGSAFAYFTLRHHQSDVDFNLYWLHHLQRLFRRQVEAATAGNPRRRCGMMIRSAHATHATQGWSAFFAVLLGTIFSAAAFWNTDPEVYLFPRIAAGLMLLLALAQWAGVVIRFVKNKQQEVKRKQHPAESASTPRGLARGHAWKAFLPGIIVGISYVLIMERLGFYASSLLTFVIITSIYGKHSALDMKAPVYKVGYNIIVGLIFMVFLYALFWRLLNVRTPTGLLF